MGVTTSPIDWYTARAAGILAYLILTVVVLLGLTLSGQLRLPLWPKFALTDVHRFGGLLVGVFVSIHVTTIALDSYTPFSLNQLLVPFSAHYRPLWTALGIVAAELLVAVAITNALRARIPYRWWRRIHILNFAVWGAATAHGIGSGTDTPSTWMTLIYVISVSSVLAALAWRLTRRRLTPSAVRSLASATGLLGIAAVLALVAALHTGATNRTAVKLPGAFAETFNGSLSQQAGAGGAMLSIIGRGSGARQVLVRIDLVSPDSRSITGTALQLKDTKTGSICSGTISAIGARGFAGTCTFTTGSARTVAATWELNAGHVTGNLTVTA
jgi:sulfoxide reductase heme-binding subunit YedZ